MGIFDTEAIDLEQNVLQKIFDFFDEEYNWGPFHVCTSELFKSAELYNMLNSSEDYYLYHYNYGYTTYVRFYNIREYVFRSGAPQDWTPLVIRNKQISLHDIIYGNI